jgi:hypothetical protein
LQPFACVPLTGFVVDGFFRLVLVVPLIRPAMGPAIAAVRTVQTLRPFAGRFSFPLFIIYACVFFLLRK